jgi:hypothetical protein
MNPSNRPQATFRLIGFDDIVELSEKKWSTEMLIKTAVVIAFGLVQGSILKNSFYSKTFRINYSPQTLDKFLL